MAQRGDKRDFRHLAKIPNERWAYLAGLFAGEGCFMIRAQNSIPTFGLQITMTDEAIVRDLEATWGGSISTSGIEGRRNMLRTAHAWRIHDGYFVQALTRRFLPFMVGEKFAQGEAFLRFVNTKLECWERKASGQPYPREDVLTLYRLAYAARNFALGASKGWRSQWDARIAQLEQEV